MLSEKKIALAERRYYNCLAIHKASKKGTWAYEFWLRTANAVKRNNDRKRPFVHSGMFSGYSLNE